MGRRGRNFWLTATTVMGLLTLPMRPLSAETRDVEMPAGANFDHAAFRLWYPDGIETVRAILVLVPGSNGDGRSQVEDAFWQELARRHGLALVGVYLTDKPHEDMFIEHYVDVRQGSGEAFLTALDRLGERVGHGELSRAPLLLWGMSAGGEFNYEMALWKPERVVGFVVNKGGIYYSALASSRARQVPGLFFVGETDLAFRNDIIRGIYSINRRARSLWALVEEPGVAHEVARSREMAAPFYEALLRLRVPSTPTATSPNLKPLALAEGFLCDPKTNRCQAAAEAPARTYPTAWLPTEALARAWLAVTTGEPF
jgi:pimeloyl-ACP methyl ester carboxylesterase